MNTAVKLSYLVAVSLLSLLSCVATAQAQDDKVHKVVIQVSSPDPAMHTTALNVTNNLLRHYGIDNVQIEIVAFSRGLGIVMPQSAEAARVKSLITQDVRFSACAVTMDKIERKKGKKPKLTEGVEIVPSGMARIIELQEQGYAYATP
jgi:intracellular sulfur oxidation DsrE/DsrF family protein